MDYQSEIANLEQKILTCKKHLKKWESVFQKKYGRSAAVKDIAERPSIGKKE